MARANNRGGRRNGAGRKPGGLNVAPRPGSVATLARSDAEDKPLEPAVQLAIAWYARGVKKAEIARRLERNLQTITSWLDQHPEEIAAEVEQVKGGAAALFRPHVPQAVETTVGLMDSADRDSTKLAAAQVVLDEALGKPVVRTEQRSQSVIRITYVDAPDPPVIDVPSVVRDD